ncbi:MAG: DUF493 domain-containing protein [Campylobacterales bacterium]|nr:DUF493 domain-containing protein [Campylobacterales bacterium]
MKILDKNNTKKPQITYPTSWGFKIIGNDKNELHNVIKEVMGEKEHLCSYGNPSKNGKFHSYNASCTVTTKEERDALFQKFQDHPSVKMVI